MSDTISASVQGFTVLVEQQAAAVQTSIAAAQPGKVASFRPGSILLAIAQATAGVALWLQGLILNLLLVARAATSSGSDLDSWMAQFQVTRIGATTATCGTVQLSRYSTSVAVTIPAGGLVMTGDGSQQFTIIQDTSQSGWNAAADGYVMGVGVASVQVTAQAVNSGAAGNVGAGTITQFASGIVGADTVTNTGAASGGADPETDPALRARFWNYLQYLWKATSAAVTYAVQTVQPGLSVTITDGYNEAGVMTPGYFFATVDDGTGSPSAALINNAAQQVQQTRALGIQAACHGPTDLVVNVAATIATNNPLVDQPAAVAAVTAYVAATKLGQTLDYFKTGAALGGASPTITEVVSMTLNGGTSAIVPSATQKIVVGTVTVSTVA
jgi:uncharacterized phage protein gp47/JayE